MIHHTPVPARLWAGAREPGAGREDSPRPCGSRGGCLGTTWATEQGGPAREGWNPDPHRRGGAPSHIPGKFQRCQRDHRQTTELGHTFQNPSQQIFQQVVSRPLACKRAGRDATKGRRKSHQFSLSLLLGLRINRQRGRKQL